ncbi:DUF5994 family protein [Catelliglobosispora koreensis]|uniref:DUF5994 family protein n=1 Tax=Catelliglobosispora koreensis TaxID=129052 RepID=UPI00039A085A|nr:DUF5994 family protein [Catelliglobosispora koreensis]
MSKPYYSPNLMILVPATARGVTQRLWLASTSVHSGMLDGAWWPRSRNAIAELPGLLAILDGARGCVIRLALSADGWENHPRRLPVAGRSPSIDYYATQPTSLLTASCADGDRIDLLVVPPDTDPGDAHAAMMMVAGSSNRLVAPR